MNQEERSAAIREIKREYYRKWRERNPEKVQAAQEKFWEKKLQERGSRQEHTD